MLVMVIIAVLVAVLFLLFLVRYAPWQSSGANPEQLQPVYVPGLLNLIDTRNLEFLELSLSSSDYRRAQRERCRALRSYVQRISHNTRVLIASAEAAQRTADPVVAESGRVLLQAALATRTRAVRALAFLYVSELFPGFLPDLSEAIQTYQLAAARLDSLQALNSQ